MKTLSAKPTQGPWHVGVMNDGLFIIDQKPCPPTEFVHPGHEPAPKVLATVHYLDGEHGRVSDANAMIMAAGWEMLRALKDIVAQWDMTSNKKGTVDQGNIQAARDAIRKAQGMED